MSIATKTARCPYCKEVISPEATKCRYCHSELTGSKKGRSPFAQYNTFRTGFLTGVAFTLVLLVLVYLQFFGDK